jgi:hypothetical protein
MFITSFSLLACTNFWWWLSLEILTQVRVTPYLILKFFFVYLKNRFSHPILTQVKINSLVFNQGITHGDTLRGSNWDAQVTSGWCLKYLWYSPNIVIFQTSSFELGSQGLGFKLGHVNPQVSTFIFYIEIRFHPCWLSFIHNKNSST